MYHVLVAEDELWIRSAIVEMVERIGNGFEVVVEAENGQEAWDLIQELWPTVLITDIRMPKKDGLSLVEQIANNRLPIVPIIISGYDTFEYAQQAIRYNVSEYLLKPVREDDLKNALERCLLRLEGVKEMSSLLLKVQGFIDTLQYKDSQMMIKEQASLVATILKEKSIHPAARMSLLRIFSGRLNELAKSEGVEFPFKDLKNSELIHQHFRLLIETIISENDQYTNNNVKLVIKKVCDYINKNYMNEVTLDEMAQYSNLSTSYFSTLFKQHTGNSFVNYVNQKRIHEAKSLLIEHDIRIYDVADMVGFSSLPYFNRVFKTIVGMPPNEYRKSLGIC